MAEALTRGQRVFAGEFAKETGLDPHVVGAWLKAEQSGGAAKGYEDKGYYNWLNIARTDSGDASGAHSDVWAHPQSAAKATAEWIKGQGRIASEYGHPAPGVAAILHHAGRSAQDQIQAIANSGWASSGYEHGHTLETLYHELLGTHLGVASAAARASGLPSPGAAAPVVPEGQHAAAPNPIDALMALTPGASPTTRHTWEAIKGLFGEKAVEPEPTGTKAMPEMLLPGETGGVDRVLRYATNHLGKFAESGGANLGPELNKLEQQFGMTGEPWCAIFATTAATQGGAQIGKTASVAQINQWANEGSHGYQRGLKSSAHARPGDLLTFGSQHVALVKEVKNGKIITVEGNANGSGGVVQLSHAVGEGQIARPKYG